MAAIPRPATTQLSVSPSDPRGPPPSSWNVRVERRDRPAPRELERGAAPDQQAAQRDDERRDADIGDEEALHAADQRADRDADQRPR